MNSGADRPDQLIEPKKQSDRFIEPEIDYSLWERLYGKSLSDVEKLEIKTNLITFFGILLDEHKKHSENK